MQKKKPHYAWAILVACCLIQGGIGGVVQNTRGIFFHPVCSDLGLETSVFTLYSMFQGISSFLFLPVYTKLLKKWPHRIVIGLAVLLYTGSAFLMGSVSRLPGFYAAAFAAGIGGALLNVYICPLLIANWFDKFYGTAMGIYASFSGLLPIFMNPVLNGVIDKLGWRNGFRIQGLIAFCMVMPAVLLIRAVAPEDCGLTRYGETGVRAPQGGEAEEAPATAIEKRLLFLMITFTIVTDLYNAASQHFSNYAAALGLASATGALLASCAMVGNVGGKFLAGVVGDRFGTRASVFSSYIVVGLGLLMMTAGNSVLIYPGAVLAGAVMPLSAVCVPMTAKYVFGLERYRKFFPVISMLNILISCVSVSLLGILYDLFKSYAAVFLVGAITIPACLLLFVIAEKDKKRNPAAAK